VCKDGRVEQMMMMMMMMMKGKDRSFVQENTFHFLRLQQSTSEPNVKNIKLRRSDK
jgi:hypothetical protein